MSNWEPEIDSDEETADEIGHSWGLRDGVIYLIEVSESMLEESEDKTSLFRTCLDCCLTTMMNRVISSPNDRVAVVLYGTKESPVPMGSYSFNPTSIPPHVSVFMVLQEPSAENIKWLRDIKNSTNLNNFKQKFGISTDFSIADALEACMYLFRTNEVKLQTSTIFLFTNNDNPHADDSHKKQQAIRRALDLSALGIDFDLVPLVKTFNSEPFYKEIICSAMQLDPLCFRMPDPELTIERLLTRVIKRDHRHRCTLRIKWFLSDDVALTVGVYNMCRATAQPRPIHLERDTNELVTAVQRYHQITIDDNNQKIIGDPVPHSELRLAQIFGGEEIIFLPEEVKALKRITEPGIRLLGFKPMSALPLEYHLKPPSFIYPLDDILEGSSKLFTALLERCAARKKMAICSFTPKRNYSVCFIALIPQLEEVAQYDLQLKPPGFHLVYLPSAENFRSLDIGSETGPTPVSSVEIDVMKSIVNKLKFTYSPLNIENPKLQTIYSHIEALALDLDTARNVDDDTLPDLEVQRALLEDLSEQFSQLFGPDEPPPKGRKRPNEESDSGSTKSSKIDGTDVLDVQAKIVSGQANACSVNQLKEFLKFKGRTGLTGKKKADLVDMANEYR